MTLVEHARPADRRADLHDPLLADEPELVDAVAVAAGLWLDNERLQAKLRAQIEFLETIVNASPSLLCSLDREGRIVEPERRRLAGERLRRGERRQGAAVLGRLRRPRSAEPSGAAGSRRRRPRTRRSASSTRSSTSVGERLTIAWSTAPLYDDGREASATSSAAASTSPSASGASPERARERDFLRTSPTPPRACSSSSTTRRRSSATRSTRASSARSGWTEQEMLGRKLPRPAPPRRRELGPTRHRLRASTAPNPTELDLALADARRQRADDRLDGDADRRRRTARRWRSSCGVDATERERREAELRSSEERLRAAIEASPVAIVEYALDDTITRWNPAAERIFGWTAEQVIGGKAKHQPPGREAELAELFRRVRAGEVYTGVESTRVRSDGVDSRRRDRRSADPRRRPAASSATWRSSPTSPSASARRRSCWRRGPGSWRPATRRASSSSATSTTARSSGSSPSPSRCGSPSRRWAPIRPEQMRFSKALAKSSPPRSTSSASSRAGSTRPCSRTAAWRRRSRRSRRARPCPVEFETPAEELPRPVAAAGYYVIAEALANVIKYAGATAVNVRVAREDGRAIVTVSDDGVGGADPGGGSGLRGLADRVEALGGSLVGRQPASRGHLRHRRDPAADRSSAVGITAPPDACAPHRRARLGVGV